MHSLAQVGEIVTSSSAWLQDQGNGLTGLHKTHPSVASPKLHEGVAQGKPAMMLSKHFLGHCGVTCCRSVWLTHNNWCNCWSRTVISEVSTYSVDGGELFSWRRPMGQNVLIYCMTSMLRELLKKTFSLTYDATMSLYNINIMVKLVVRSVHVVAACIRMYT